MEKETKKTDNVKDPVEAEVHNKVIEAHNSLKIEKEKLEKDLKEVKEKFEGVKIEKEEKENWKKEKEELKKEIDDIKKQQESVVKAKGIVQKELDKDKTYTQEEVKKIIDTAISTEGIKNPKLFASNIQRYGYYKGPTKKVTDETLGRGLSLDASRQRTSKDKISGYAKSSPDDTVVYKNKKTLG